MARRRQGDDEDFKIIDNEKSLEAYARVAQQYADAVIDYIEDRTSRLNANLRREYGSLSQALEKHKDRRQDESRNTDTAKMRMLANIINESGRGGKFDTSKGAIARAVVTEVSGLIQDVAKMYIAKPVKDAISNMQSAYENNFTEIAGRMGTDRKATYNTMKSAVTTLNRSYARSAIDANKELIPELQKISAQGWKGQESISIALTNSIDHKIMPWLETASDAWTNLQFNLSDNQIKTLKAQQLILQESRSGNRLLQSGVINQLTNEMQPLLSNIDYGVNADKLDGQLKGIMQTFVDQGYTPQEAYAEAKNILDVYKDPTKGFETGDYNSVMRAEAAYNGGDAYDIAMATIDGVKEIASAGMDAGFISRAYGITPIDGVNRAESFMRQADAMESMTREGITGSATDYDKVASKVSEKVTATYAHDTGIANATTSLAYFTNEIPHGVDLLESISSHTANILKALIAYGIGKVAVNAGSKLLGKAAGEGGGEVAKSLISKLGGEGIKSAVNSAIGKGSVAKAAGEGLASGGLIGGLTQGGAAMSFGKLSGAAATKLGATTSVAGGLMVGAGAKSLIDTYRNRDELSSKDRAVGYGTGGAAVVGGSLGIAGSLGLLGAASGPIGWTALAVGGIALLGKAAYDSQKKMQNSTKGLIDEYDKSIETIRTESLNRRKLIDEIKEQIKDAPDADRARKIAVNEGIVTADQAAQMTQSELEALAKKYEKATEEQSMAEQLTQERLKAEHTTSNTTNVTSFMKALGGLYDSTAFGNLTKNFQMTGRFNDSIDLSADAQADNNANKGTAQLLTYIKQAASENDTEDAKALVATITNKFKSGKLLASDMISILENAQKSLTAEQIEKMDSSYSGVSLLEGYVNYRDKGTDIYKHTMENNDWSFHPDWYKPNDTSEADGLIAYLESLKRQGVDRNAPAYQNAKKKLEEMSVDVSSYAVGTPYIAHDQLAMVHEGEAILTKSDNTERLRSLLGLNNQQVNATQVSSKDIVNAISSQTDSLRQVLQQLLTAVQSGNTKSVTNPFNNRWQGNSAMSPTIANTRPV